MTSLKANEILKNKFWIIEDKDTKEKVGTLSKDTDNRYMYSCKDGSWFYDSKNTVERDLGSILWSKGSISDKSSPSKEIYELPTSTNPYNAMFDLKRKFALFTKSKKSKTPVLDNFGRDITLLAENNKLDPVVGREKEIQRVSQILSRRKKNNPLLIGEPGVGLSLIHI